MAHTTHLPRCHLAIVSDVRVAVPLDGPDVRSLGNGWRVHEPFLAPDAGREGGIPSLVVLVVDHVSLAVDRELVAEKFSRVVARELDPQAGRCCLGWGVGGSLEMRFGRERGVRGERE